MKYLSLLLLLLLVSCSENELFKNDIFNNGDVWKYSLETHPESADSNIINPKYADSTILILYTEIYDSENFYKTHNYNDSVTITGDISELDGELVNRWVEYYPVKDKKANNTTSTIKVTKVELYFPSLGDEVLWYNLPKLQIDGSLEVNETEEDELSYKNSDGEEIQYPYTLKYLGKVYYSNPVVKDSCDHYQIDFIFKGNDKKYNGKKCSLNYYFHEEHGFVYIKLNIGTSEYYKLEVIDIKQEGEDV